MVYGPPAASLLEHGHVRATHLLLYQVIHSHSPTPVVLTFGIVKTVFVCLVACVDYAS